MFSARQIVDVIVVELKRQSGPRNSDPYLQDYGGDLWLIDGTVDLMEVAEKIAEIGIANE